jgi:hypothetical protein
MSKQFNIAFYNYFNYKKLKSKNKKVEYNNYLQNYIKNNIMAHISENLEKQTTDYNIVNTKFFEKKKILNSINRKINENKQIDLKYTES